MKSDFLESHLTLSVFFPEVWMTSWFSVETKPCEWKALGKIINVQPLSLNQFEGHAKLGITKESTDWSHTSWSSKNFLLASITWWVFHVELAEHSCWEKPSAYIGSCTLRTNCGGSITFAVWIQTSPGLP